MRWLSNVLQLLLQGFISRHSHARQGGDICVFISVLCLCVNIAQHMVIIAADDSDTLACSHINGIEFLDVCVCLFVCILRNDTTKV